MVNHTETRRMPAVRPVALVAVLAALAGSSVGCKKKTEGAGAEGATAAKHQSIQNIGSDTMVNLAQAWAEEYSKAEAGISVEVAGGGSGVGVAALINGTADIANCSR